MVMRLCQVNTVQKAEPIRRLGIWASNLGHFGKWSVDDTLVVFVGREQVGVARVAGPVFCSDDVIWNDDLYAFRVPLVIEAWHEGQEGLSLNRDLRRILIEKYGVHYGVLLRNSSALPASIKAAVHHALR